jgi:hypothetical protein
VPAVLRDRRRRARCVPDRPVSLGNLRSFPDRPIRGSPACGQADAHAPSLADAHAPPCIPDRAMHRCLIEPEHIGQQPDLCTDLCTHLKRHPSRPLSRGSTTSMSGWRDSNPRPRAPKARALAKLRYSPSCPSITSMSATCLLQREVAGGHKPIPATPLGCVAARASS